MPALAGEEIRDRVVLAVGTGGTALLRGFLTAGGGDTSKERCGAATSQRAIVEALGHALAWKAVGA